MQHEKHIGLQIKTLANLIKREFDKSAGSSSELTVTQRWVIGYLSRHEGQDVFQRDLEKDFKLRRSTMSGILRLMEENTLITREPIAGDARLKKLVMTDKAVEICRAIEVEIDKMEERLSHGLTDKELSEFTHIIDKIKTNLSEEKHD